MSAPREVAVCLTCGTVGTNPNTIPPRAGHWHTPATVDLRTIEESWIDRDGKSVLGEALRVLAGAP